MAIVKGLAGTPAVDQETIEEKCERLERENAEQRALLASGRFFGKLTYRVSKPRKAGTNGKDDEGSKGGAICIFGINSRPVTLYKEQLERLLNDADNARKFIAEHESELSVKTAKAA